MNKHSPCLEWTTKLALRQEDFSSSEWSKFETHLRTCPGCLKRRAEYGILLSEIQMLPPPANQPISDLFTYSSRMHCEEALGAYNSALYLDLVDQEASLKKASELFLLSEYKKALEICNQALEHDLEKGELWTLKSQILTALGRIKEALAACEQALSHNPHEVLCVSMKAKLLYSLKRYEEAIQTCDYALTFTSSKGGIWKVKCRSLLALRRYRKALEAGNCALEEKPEDVELWHLQAIAPFLLEREEEREGEEDLLQLDPNYVIDPSSIERWADHVRLLALENPQQYENALKACNQALQLDPKRKKLWEMKGRILIALGQYDDALGVFKQSISLHSGDAEEWRFLGCVYNRLGCYKNARIAFKRAKKLDPNRENVWGQTTASLLPI